MQARRGLHRYLSPVHTPRLTIKKLKDYEQCTRWPVFISIVNLHNLCRLYYFRYRKNVARTAELWRDENPLQTPKERMAHLLELLIKYRHLDHLLIKDKHLNIFQYFCLDVILFLAAITSLLFYLAVWACNARDRRIRTVAIGKKSK